MAVTRSGIGMRCVLTLIAAGRDPLRCGRMTMVCRTPESFGGGPYSSGMTYGLFGKFSAQPGKRDDLVGHLLQAAKLLERNSGCVHYIVSTSDEPEAVWVSEIWTDEAAHDASLEPEDIQALIQEARPLIAGMSDQTQLTVHGGKGLPG